LVVEQGIQAQIEELAAPHLPKRKGVKIKTSQDAEFVALTFTRSPEILVGPGIGIIDLSFGKENLTFTMSSHTKPRAYEIRKTT
jgi:hypothetical protein